jgi:uncharacterized protein DUF3179
MPCRRSMFGSDTTTAFRAQLNFTAANTGATELTDTQTQSRWTAYGHCSSGALKGSDLEPLILEPEYWFAWAEFHPDTTIYGAH